MATPPSREGSSPNEARDWAGNTVYGLAPAPRVPLREPRGRPSAFPVRVLPRESAATSSMSAILPRLDCRTPTPSTPGVRHRDRPVGLKAVARMSERTACYLPRGADAAWQQLYGTSPSSPRTAPTEPADRHWCTGRRRGARSPQPATRLARPHRARVRRLGRRPPARTASDGPSPSVLSPRKDVREVQDGREGAAAGKLLMRRTRMMNLPQDRPGEPAGRRLRSGRRSIYLDHHALHPATAPIHIGHAFNKILKAVNKSHAQRGFFTPYVPGWDCHGQPIEHMVEKTLGRGRWRRSTSPRCAASAASGPRSRRRAARGLASA